MPFLCYLLYAGTSSWLAIRFDYSSLGQSETSWPGCSESGNTERRPAFLPVILLTAVTNPPFVMTVTLGAQHESTVRTYSTWHSIDKSRLQCHYSLAARHPARCPGWAVPGGAWPEKTPYLRRRAMEHLPAEQITPYYYYFLEAIISSRGSLINHSSTHES